MPFFIKTAHLTEMTNIDKLQANLRKCLCNKLIDSEGRQVLLYCVFCIVISLANCAVLCIFEKATDIMIGAMQVVSGLVQCSKLKYLKITK